MNRSIKPVAIILVVLLALLLVVIIAIACNLPSFRSPTPTPSPEVIQTSIPETETPPEPETTEEATVVCALPAGWEEITVEQGDTLAALAEEYGITVQELLEANCLPLDEFLDKAEEALEEPQVIYVPTTAVEQPVACQYPTGWVAYEASKGESYAALAEKYGIAVEELLIANCLPVNELLPLADQGLEEQKIIYVPPLAGEVPVVCQYPDGWVKITVEVGQSYASIAQLYGISVEVLLTSNCLPTEDYLKLAAEGVAEPIEIYVPGTGEVYAVGETPHSYTLKPGEFPYCIARRFDVDPNQLLRINGLSYSTYYYSGTKLKIPQTGDTFPGKRALRAHPATYTVKSDENIYAVACKYGDVRPEEIAIANGLSEPYKLSNGQELIIP